MWDTGREDETVIATSGMGSDSHREPVSKVCYTTNLKPRIQYNERIHPFVPKLHANSASISCLQANSYSLEVLAKLQ